MRFFMHLGNELTMAEMKHFKARAPGRTVVAAGSKYGGPELRNYHVRASAQAAAVSPENPTRVIQMTMQELDFGSSIQSQAYLDAVGSKHASAAQRCHGRRMQMASASSMNDD